MRVEYASVWTRFASLVIDGFLANLFLLPYYVFLFRLDPAMDFPDSVLPIVLLSWLAFFIFFIYNGVYKVGKTGQSYGRQFLNIAVLDEHGRPIGYGRAFLRETIGRWLSGLVCYIGYLNAFWDNRRQMWHDKLATCYVYYVDEDYPRTPAFGPAPPPPSERTGELPQPPAPPAPDTQPPPPPDDDQPNTSGMSPSA